LELKPVKIITNIVKSKSPEMGKTMARKFQCQDDN